MISVQKPEVRCRQCRKQGSNSAIQSMKGQLSLRTGTVRRPIFGRRLHLCLKSRQVTARASCLQSTLQLSDMVGSVYRFDSGANMWSIVAPMLLCPRADLPSLLSGSTYVAGVFDGNHNLSSVEQYCALLDIWEPLNGMELSGARVPFGAQVIWMELGLFDKLELD
jgi:hypothetical protein